MEFIFVRLTPVSLRCLSPFCELTVWEFCLRFERLSSSQSLALRGLGPRPLYVARQASHMAPNCQRTPRPLGHLSFLSESSLLFSALQEIYLLLLYHAEVHNALWGRLKASNSLLSKQGTILLLPSLAGPYGLLWLSRVHLTKLLSHFSHVRLCVTPKTAAHQAPPSLGSSRQEHWSGLPFPSPMHESEKWKWSRPVVSDSVQPHGLPPTRLLRPWDFPGKSTGVGCHCLLRIWLRVLHKPLSRGNLASEDSPKEAGHHLPFRMHVC